jgi:imidazolonepropionase-like amidohydrolase
MGVDFVKYGATGDGRPVNSEIGQAAVLRFSPRQQRAIVETAHAAGKTINTHATSAEALLIALEVGVDFAQHCNYTGPSRIPDSTIQLMLDKKFSCGTQWQPLSEAEQRQVREEDFIGSDAENGNENVDYSLENAVRMIKAGVPMLVSTDAGTIDPDVAKEEARGGLAAAAARVIGEAEFLNMRAMRQYGMTPMMIIQAATKNIAAAYGMLDELGTLEPGKFADLVVLDADPLQDIENMRKVSLVMKEGRTIDRDTLPRNPILTSPEAANPGAVRTK